MLNSSCQTCALSQGRPPRQLKRQKRQSISASALVPFLLPLSPTNMSFRRRRSPRQATPSSGRNSLRYAGLAGISILRDVSPTSHLCRSGFNLQKSYCFNTGGGNYSRKPSALLSRIGCRRSTTTIMAGHSETFSFAFLFLCWMEPLPHVHYAFQQRVRRFYRTAFE